MRILHARIPRHELKAVCRQLAEQCTEDARKRAHHSVEKKQEPMPVIIAPVPRSTLRLGDVVARVVSGRKPAPQLLRT